MDRPPCLYTPITSSKQRGGLRNNHLITGGYKTVKHYCPSSTNQERRAKMSEDTKKAGRGQHGIQRNNQTLTIEDWINRYKEATRFMSDEDRQELEGYRSSIREGILRATGDGSLFYYEQLEIRIECYEIELMIKFFGNRIQNFPGG